MKRITYSILVSVYIISGLFYIPGEGKISLYHENSVSSKNSSPKTHFLTSAKIPKHVAPTFHPHLDIHDLCEQQSRLNKNGALFLVVYDRGKKYDDPNLLFPANKAPPLA